MRIPRTPSRGWAKITLGLSFLFAVAVFIYFTLAGTPLNGIVLGVLVVITGIWEYRRKRQDEIMAERYEAEAEEQRHRR